nr:ubiquitin hydrolase [Tanacetum cinerariifolium]
MVKTSSSSENESCCSKTWKKNTNGLNSKITDLEDKLFDAKNLIYHYKLALAQVNSRLVEYKEREVKYCKKIRTLEFMNESNNECIEILKKKLETLKEEKEGVDGKLAGLLTTSKDLDNLIKIQSPDKNKEGLGYSAVPPPPAQLYLSPKKDLSWTGLPECADDIVTDYSRPSPTIEIDRSAEKPTTNKVETAKKPSVKYAKQYRKPTKKSTVKGNQRNCNNLKSQQLGENFVRKNKACVNCGHFDHLAYDCGLGVKKGRTCPTYTHKSITPRPGDYKPYRPCMRPMRSNMNGSRPNRTSFYKPTHSYNKRPFQETTQNLVAILIQRVKRLERELKARTPIQKVDRGRSRPVMAWVPKKKKFPLLEEVPTARVILPLLVQKSSHR